MSDRTHDDAWQPRLVALDIDGTVANWEDAVSPRVRSAVGKARAAGAHVLLSTGRSMLAVHGVARTLELTDVVHVCSNGAVVARLDPEELVDVVTFDAGPVVRLLSGALPDALFAVEELGRGYRATHPFPPGELTGDVQLSSIDDLVEQPVTRVVVRQPDAKAEEFLEVVQQLGLHGVNYVVGFTAWLDIAPEGVSKASALDRVAERLGIDPADALAIGDGRNDIEMLAWAGRGVAMGDAVPEVREAADSVTGTFAQDGAAVELERWFGES